MRWTYVKSVRIWTYSGPYFPAFVLNTERYAVLKCYTYTDNFQQNCHEIGPLRVFGGKNNVPISK